MFLFYLKHSKVGLRSTKQHKVTGYKRSVPTFCSQRSHVNEHHTPFNVYDSRRRQIQFEVKDHTLS